MFDLNDYAAQLKARREASRDARPAHERQEAPIYTPLPEQIATYVLALPPVLRNQPVSIPNLIPHLQGKYREHPHPLHVARALRSLGFTPVRSWRKSVGIGARLWLAPGIDIL